MQKKRKEQLENIIEELIGNEFEKYCKQICTKDYYKFKFLDYAMLNHSSVQCIGRTYAEMQKTYYKDFSHDASDLKQVNQIISYLNLYSDDAQLNFVSEIFSELKNAIYNRFEYVMMTFKGRFKGFRSHFVKVISKIIMDKTIKHIRASITSFPEIKDFSVEDLLYVRKIIESLLDTNTKKNPSKDCIGYRFIVDAVDYSTDEKVLKKFIYELFDFCKDFFFEQGYDIIEVKDYIKEPKDNNYQSLHFTVDIMGLPVEIQLRTNQMDYVAEFGSASHNKIYKDTILQNFVKDFMYGISKELNKVAMNERSGLLISQSIPKSSICRTPHSEVPATPALLEDFDDLDLLKEIFENSPQI